MAEDLASKTIGMVWPTRETGGSKVTTVPGEMVAHVALLDEMVSAGLKRYGPRLKLVSWPAGTVITVGLGALEVVAGAVMLAELDGATIVTLIVNV